MERALRATEDRGINVGGPILSWFRGGPIFCPIWVERTFRARHREGGFGGATAPPDNSFHLFFMYFSQIFRMDASCALVAS